MQFLLGDFYRAIKMYGWCLGTFRTQEEKILLARSAWGNTDSAKFLKGPVVHWGPWLGSCTPTAHPDLPSRLQQGPKYRDVFSGSQRINFKIQFIEVVHPLCRICFLLPRTHTSIHLFSSYVQCTLRSKPAVMCCSSLFLVVFRPSSTSSILLLSSDIYFSSIIIELCYY